MLVLKKSSIEKTIEFLEKSGSSEELLKSLKEKANHLNADQISLKPQNISDENLKILKEIASDNKDRSMLIQVNLIEKIRKNPGETKINSLRHVTQAVELWFLENIINGWIFIKDKNSDELTPYTVESVRYKSSMHREDHVEVLCQANAPIKKNGRGDGRGENQSTKIIIFNQADCPSTIDELMAKNNVFHETEDLIDEYHQIIKRHKEILAQPNEQFFVKPGIYDRISGYEKHIINKANRAINDETLLQRNYRKEAQREKWEEIAESHHRTLPETAFSETPILPIHLVYDLEAHEECWVLSNALTEYIYKPEKVNLLVLPEDHRELIEILTQNVDVLMEDVVDGKSGGCTIMLEGEPGLGKTLLPTIYSEVMKRPLYSVQAGQLGVTAEDVSKGLKKIYENTNRWKAILLIDEADTYCRKRDNNLEYNAVVAALLNALEIQQTSMPSFFTTNRSDDIDDAIMSRCIAIIHFDKPFTEDARQIWKIQSNVMNIAMPDEVIEEALEKWKDGKGRQRTAGRDIRAILKLVKRYIEAKKEPVTFEIVLKMAGFKRF